VCEVPPPIGSDRVKLGLVEDVSAALSSDPVGMWLLLFRWTNPGGWAQREDRHGGLNASSGVGRVLCGQVAVSTDIMRRSGAACNLAAQCGSVGSERECLRTKRPVSVRLEEVD